jgi:hypothetical protein
MNPSYRPIAHDNAWPASVSPSALSSNLPLQDKAVLIASREELTEWHGIGLSQLSVSSERRFIQTVNSQYTNRTEVSATIPFAGNRDKQNRSRYSARSPRRVSPQSSPERAHRSLRVTGTRQQFMGVILSVILGSANCIVT